MIGDSSDAWAKIDDVEGQRDILGAQHRPQEGRRGKQTRLRRRYEPKKVSRELQEAPKELQSHDPLSLPRDYELPRSHDTL